jgi:hypothetical protein
VVSPRIRDRDVIASARAVVALSQVLCAEADQVVRDAARTRFNARQAVARARQLRTHRREVTAGSGRSVS